MALVRLAAASDAAIAEHALLLPPPRFNVAFSDVLLGSVNAYASTSSSDSALASSCVRRLDRS